MESVESETPTTYERNIIKLDIIPPSPYETYCNRIEHFLKIGLRPDSGGTEHPGSSVAVGSLYSAASQSVADPEHARKKPLSLWLKPTTRYSFKSAESSSSSDDDSVDSYDILMRVFGGTLVFQSATDDDLRQDYVMMDKDLSLEDLAKFMSKVWKLRVPGIVLSVISNSDYFDGGTDSEVEDFQIGIIQAARLTKMWILTEGINAGVPRIIGEAVTQEQVKRKVLEKDLSRRVGGDMVVIGIAATDDLWYGEAIEKTTQPVEHLQKFVVENKGDDSHELNSQHTHFLIVKSSEQADKDLKWNTRFLIESKLIQHLTNRRSHKTDENWEIDYYSPVVGLLVQGGPKEIERVLWLLRKKIPVIVIKRKGFASGLLAYAYSEGIKGGDSDHLQNIVKPQLMQQVVEAFPEFRQDNEIGRMNCRDKILECVKHAVQGESRYLTILDPSLRGVDQKDLNKFILTAIFNAHKADYSTITRENINKYLTLTLHWNSPEFARRELVPKMERLPFPVKDDLFMEALLLPEREQFVEIFLNMGFQLRRFLTETSMLYLYQESLNNDFFVHICLERILHSSWHSLGKKFLEGSNCQLNSVLFTLTGVPRLVQPNQLFAGQVARKEDEKLKAERKALLALIYWAVLTNRQALAKVLWKRSSEPIAVALVISNMYYHMSHDWIIDIDLKRKLKSAAVDFSTLAVEMMDLIYNDSSLMAYYALVNPLSDFNNLNVVDLALIGNNIFFIAHPCCQRSMRARWLGRLKIKSFAWDPVIIPEFVKIFLCLFLFFPMYFWLTFNPEKRTNISIEDDDQEEETDTDDKSQKQDWQSRSRRYFKDDLYKSPPVWKKIYYLWTAPISKYWINQLFIMLYLALFALALTLPYCGNMYLNMIVCGWTAIRFMESALRTIETKLKYPTFDVIWSVVGLLADIYISSVSALLVYQQMFNITPTPLGYHLDYTTYKFLLSLGLLWVFFRSLRFILPISQDLGPMLVNISELTRKDLINWLRLWLVCAISGGFAINAVVYPAQSFNFTNFWRSQLRACLAIFLTEVEDLKGDISCSPLYDAPEICCTCNVSSIPPYIRQRLETCPYVSLAGYLLVIQQLLITRHVFYTLMFAMFRSILPVPFTPITYPFRITYCVTKWLARFILNLTCCTKLRKKLLSGEIQHYDIPYHQWKSYVAAMTKKEEEKETHIQDILAELEEGSDAHGVMIKRLNERVVHIERNQILAGFILESIMNNLEALDPSSHAQRGQLRRVHTASRSSPYPGTYITRFPVLEKDVSWEVKFESYDPSTYTKPVEEFPRDVQMWIDRDILKLRVQLEEQGLATTEETGPVSGLLPDPIFNTIQMVKLSNDKEIAINRVSYITAGEGALQYEIDSTGAPRNPMGRTGLRGRGNQWRWGPNHMIQAVISRWAKAPAAGHVTDTSGQATRTNVGGKNMEILVVKDSVDPNLMYLPGTRVQSGMTSYSSICSYIARDILDESLGQMEQEYDQDDMIEYFSKFTTSDMRKKKKSMYTTLGYSAFLVYHGYADDAANTDNAWKETEIWNFHYKYKDSLDSFVKYNDSFSWMSASSAVRLPPSEYVAVLEAQKIHDQR